MNDLTEARISESVESVPVETRLDRFESHSFVELVVELSFVPFPCTTELKKFLLVGDDGLLADD